MLADIIVGLQYGDCGKGKITYHLCKTKDYTHVIRYNGGCNAGHTIYHNGQKHVTHHIPAGVFFGIKSIIGPGCVVDIEQFFKEIKELEERGIQTKGLVFISNNTHVITENHLEEDQLDSHIGTTKRGNGPAYRDKYDRKGIRAEYFVSTWRKWGDRLRPYLIDTYEELHVNEEAPRILFEGAQGFGLDIDWGDYPYVTSSHCTAASALLNGIPPQAVRNVWGVAKAYETYVGAKQFQPKDPVFNAIQQIGEEYGATTGRKRQCNWMNWNLIEKAININGVTDLVLNKVDVLEKLGKYVIKENDISHKFNNLWEMKGWITDKIASKNVNVYFSGNKNKI